MTDKEIIIDGVQFNKFGDFYIDYALDGHFQSISSSAKEYKILKSLIEQLKRKEQECEQYKKSKQACYETMQREWNEAKNEVKQLKKEVEKYKQLADSFEADFYNALSDKESNLLKKYKQALQDIKEIAKFQLKDYCKDFRILNCNIDVIKQILQKCEVLDE